MQISFTLTSKVSLTDTHREEIGAAARKAAVDTANEIEEQVAMEILGIDEDQGPG